MSTTERGKDFEKRVYAALKRELTSEQLGLKPSACRVYLGKKYYSNDRKRMIPIDVSLEVYQPNAKTWSLLWAWECKSYTSAVPVGEIEQFWSVLSQIAGANVKGGIAISGVLQAGALEYARSRGFAIVRLLPEDKVEWLDYFQPDVVSVLPSLEMCVDAITNDSFVSKDREFFCMVDDIVFDDWASLAKSVLPLTPISEIGNNEA